MNHKDLPIAPGMAPMPFMPACPMYARAYVPYQMPGPIFPLEEGLDKGTIFPVLVDGYQPKEGKSCNS